MFHIMESDDGVVDIHLASSRGEVNVIDELLIKNMDVDCCTNFGWTPLMCAARNGHLNAFQKLIDHGANILHTNKLGISGLNIAVASGNKEMIELILKSLKNMKNCLLKEYLIFPFLIVIVYEDIYLLRLFLDMEEELINITDKFGVSPLMIAAASSKDETARGSGSDCKKILVVRGSNTHALVDMQSFIMLDKRDFEEMGITCTESQQKLLSIIDLMKKSV